MAGDCVLVLDVGKSNTKLTLWTAAGRRLAGRVRPNSSVRAPTHAALDVEGIESWLEGSLAELSEIADVGFIVPVAHGAAAALLDGDQLALPPACYEEFPPPPLYAEYDALRDPFVDTGSPRFPEGLNLGAQLYRLETLAPQIWPSAGVLVTYPQYWAWRLSGIASTEVTSLGCHSDLWRPFERRFSNLAVKRGWAERFAPLRDAREILGPITREWAHRTGLPSDCQVLCGVHDSNAAFHGARAHSELAGRDVTVISTGTWFVAMRAPAPESPFDPGRLCPERDTLLNVDIDGNPAPSARFMGGREVEFLVGGDDSPLRAPDFVRDVAPKAICDVLVSGSMIAPTFARGVGPFPKREGRWEGPELKGAARRAAVGLYLALVADASLSLIGACDAIVVEGRFAEDASFIGMLASLRSDADVYITTSNDALAFGAQRLVNDALTPPEALKKASPLPYEVGAYASRWKHALVGGRERA
ncbi:FGGY-family carbohydrate kinase [Terricaulis silvestris]|uniref:L-fuculokinase n=1 Tax=Terricaulis silvestris TaxID=2686094 RepID=A0A6I6MNI7_9CAUL|nr:carbohydrate kinase [Terricaulis silvestris]QGZ94918.1 L-fuculokinase [Terricaulis silvestris]